MVPKGQKGNLKAGPSTSIASLTLYIIGQNGCKPAWIFSMGKKQLTVANFETSYHIVLKGEHESNWEQ